MAENKNSFLLYCDLIHTVSKLPDDKAGELFKHILYYVNDKEPQTDDLLLNVAFEPIKQALKRDLKKWEGIADQKSEAGIVSAFNKFKYKIDSVKNTDLEFLNIEIEKLQSKEISNGDTRYVDLCLTYLNNLKKSLTKSTRVESVATQPTKSTVSVNVSVSDINNNNINRHEDFKKQCLLDEQWKESVCINVKLKPDHFNPALTEYNNHLILMDEPKHNIKDYKQHFANWSRKQIKN